MNIAMLFSRKQEQKNLKRKVTLGYKKEMGFNDAFHLAETGVFLPFVSLGAFLSTAAAVVSFRGCFVSGSSDMFSITQVLKQMTEHLLHKRNGIA